MTITTIELENGQVIYLLAQLKSLMRRYQEKIQAAHKVQDVPALNKYYDLFDKVTEIIGTIEVAHADQESAVA